MTLASYSELKTAVIGYMGRDGDTDFVAQVPMFINLCEVRLNRALRDGDNNTQGTMTTGATGQATLPTDFRQMRSVNCGTTMPVLEYLTPHEAKTRYGLAEADTPVAYTIEGRTFMLYPPWAGTVNISYYAKLTSLSDAAPSNWLLEKHPDAYLFGSLSEAIVFTGLDDPRATLWEQKFQGALEDMKQMDMGGRWGRGRAQVPGGIIP